MIKSTKDFLDVLENINKNNLKPFYIINSEQSYIIDEFIEKFKSIIPDELKSFNQFIFYDHDSKAEDIASIANNYPISGDLQIIIIKGGDKIISKLDLFKKHIENYSNHCSILLCLNGKKIDKRKKIIKHIIDSGGLIEFQKIYDNQLLDWVIHIGKSNNLHFDYEIVEIIKERTGNNLSKISNEIKKIALMSKKDISAKELVYEFFGINNEFKIFDLQKELGNKNYDKAFKISKYFTNNSKKYPPQLIFASLHNYFLNLFQIKSNLKLSSTEISKLTGIYHEFILNDYRKVSKNYSLKEIVNVLAIIKDYDGKSKGYKKDKYFDSELLQFISEIKT
tara:strand:- start:4145 stop:5155 length:1011 start_codon:yes stop_codon:yes gene_type:complete